MTFRSGDERCVGRLYRPDRPADPALVVMTGGLVGASAFGLDRYAERLAAAGYAVFHFDVRHAGDSDGDPRNLLSPARQRADWEAALAGLRGRRDVATEQIVLWGADLSGGAVLDVAADDPRVAAVVAQTPILSGRALLRARGIKAIATGTLAGVRDRVQSLLGTPYTLPVVDDGSDEGGSALVSAPSAYRGYRDLVGDEGWANETPARSVISLLRHTGEEDRDRLSCPVCFLCGERDDLVAIESVEAVAEDLADATLVRLPVGHFDLYGGSGLEQAVGHGRAFLDTTVDP
ncbi:alpha/beta hydrolase [Halobellus sp. Atlit-31R]|nr:alpha/beta hydrolase [Halobellus sp. Atlit-31R]